jgi:hypothetical protein
VVNVRADGIAVVLGPLLRDVRILAAALVDVDSGMVLDAWSAGGEATGAPDLELIGAQHAEIVRCALQLLRTWTGRGDAADECEVVLGADDGCRHILRTVPDPHGDRLALAVVVNGPPRVLERVRKRMQAVSVDALTAGPSMIRRPAAGGWSFDPPGPDVPAQPEPRAVRPPGVGSTAGRPVPGPELPRPRGGRPVPAPGVPTPRGPAAAAPTVAGAVPAMAGLRPPSPPVAAPPGNTTPAYDGARGDTGQGVGHESGRGDVTAVGDGTLDDSTFQDGTDGDASPAGIPPVVIPAEPAARVVRRPVLFSVPGGDPRPPDGQSAAAPVGPRDADPAEPPAATAAHRPPRAPVRPAPPRPPSPPAALPAPAPPRRPPP